MEGQDDKTKECAQPSIMSHSHYAYLLNMIIYLKFSSLIWNYYLSCGESYRVYLHISAIVYTLVYVYI